MKTNFKRIGKRTISVILSMMMVFSSLFVGTLTTANAAATNVYLTGTFNNWATSSAEWKLTKNGSNFTGTFIIEEQSANYEFKTIVDGTWYACGGYWFKSDATGPFNLYTGDLKNDQIQCIDSTNNKIKLDVIYNDTNKQLTIEQSAVSALSATLTADNQTLTYGGTATVTPSVTGGSGKYTHSYKVTDESGNVVNGLLNGTTFTAPNVSTAAKYTITDTITDSHSLLSSFTVDASVTITVNPSKNANEVTPTFVDGKTTNSVSITKDVATQLDVTAELVGVGGDYTLTYSTVCSDENITITNANTATPTITSSENGKYTLTTTVTNDANTSLIATRTTEVTVTDEKIGDEVTGKYLLYSTNKFTSLNDTTVDKDHGHYKLYKSLDAEGTAIANEYKAYLDLNTLESGSNYYFAYSTDSNKKAPDKATYSVAEEGDFGSNLGDGIVNSEKQDQDGYYYVFINFKDKVETDTAKYTLTGITITINTSSKKYTVEPKYTTETITPVPSDADLVIYAKDGVRDLGITSIDTTVDGVGFNNYYYDDDDYYGKYFVEKGKRPTLKITTKMQVNLSTGYYVGGFNINGETYEAIQVRTEKRTVDAAQTEYAVYQTEYVVTGNESNCGKDKILEITPVYFNSKIEDAGDYVTVYVDSESLGAGTYGDGLGHWGNMISCYPYYLTTSDYDLGSYPGQVMLKDNNGKYYTKVPKVHYTIDGERTTHAVTGLTFNSYTENGIHSSLIELETYDNGRKNYQTYDYDDFAVIAAMGYDTVQFDIEWRNGTSNQSTLGGHVNGNYDNDSINVNTFAGSDYNGWNDLLDYDDKQIDLLGNKLTEAQKSNSTVYVVSIGNQNTQFGNRNTDIGLVGKWSTVWYVYDSEGNYITQGVPSDFIPRYATDTEGNLIKDATTGKYVINADDQTNPYKAFSNSEFVGHPVKICYESEMNATSASSENDGSGTCNGNTGKRLDGRWRYATAAGVQLPVTLQVQYTNELKTDGTTKWTNESATDVSGSKASIDSKETVDGRVETVYNERNKDAQLNAVAGSGYVFHEWGVVDAKGENYTALTSLKSSNGVLKIDKEYHLVARFVKVQAGSLVLSHKKYLGTGYAGGSGTYYISAKHYKNSSDTNPTVYSMTENEIVIPLQPTVVDDKITDTIEVTLTTVCKGQNKFLDWYELAGFDKYQMIGYEVDRYYNKPGTASYKFTVKVSELYDSKNENLLVQSLRYFSDIAPVSADGILIYKYWDRFAEFGVGEPNKEYVRKIQLSSENYNTTTQEYEVTDDMIEKNAPAIDDLTKNCKWKIEKSEFQGTKVTLVAEHFDKLHKATFIDSAYNGGAEFAFDEIPYNTLVKVTLDEEARYVRVPESDEDGDFITAKGENFLYWLVTDDKTGREVARCFYKQFVLKIVDDYTITAIYGNKLEDTVTIGAPEFTREQFTDAEGNNKKDYLYADFILAYMPSNGELIRDNTDKYDTGIILELDRNAKLTASEIAELEAARTAGTLDQTTYTIDPKYINAHLFDTNDSTIKNYAQTLNGGQAYYDATGDTSIDRIVYDFEIPENAPYNNFNRVVYYLKFNNTEAYRNYVMKAYYYVHVYETDEDGIVKTDENGNKVIKETVLSAPVYFNLYLIGTSEQVVVQRPDNTTTQ